MSKVEKNGMELLYYIMFVIGTKCPYVEDRLDLMCDSAAPEMSVNLHLIEGKDMSHVGFMYGTGRGQSGLPDLNSYIPGIITYEEVTKIINSFLADKRGISNKSSFNNNCIELSFDICWDDGNVKGINCKDITLYIYFYNEDRFKNYLSRLFDDYKDELGNVGAYKQYKNSYISGVKRNHFHSLNKKGLLEFISRMDDADIYGLLCNMDNEDYIRYSNLNMTGSDLIENYEKKYGIRPINR